MPETSFSGREYLQGETSRPSLVAVVPNLEPGKGSLPVPTPRTPHTPALTPTPSATPQLCMPC